MKTSSTAREKIPPHIKREVRQRCGFGCVKCGLPLYEYEHMEEWAVVKRHIASEITLLCDQHHREKTAGLLPKEEVRRCNDNPINLQNEKSAKYNLYFSGTSAEIWMGNNSFVSEYLSDDSELNAIIVDGLPLVQMKVIDQHLLLNLTFFDEENNVTAQIVENELIYSTSPWDIELVGTTLTIREQRGKILLRIEFNPPNKIVISSGRLLKNGIEIIIQPSKIIITNNQMTIQENRTNNCSAGLVLGVDQKRRSGFFLLTDIPRYKDFNTKQTISEMEWLTNDKRNHKMKFENLNFSHETIELDFNHFVKCNFESCTFTYRGLTNIDLTECNLNDCNWQFLDHATNTIEALSFLYKICDAQAQPMVELTFDNIRSRANSNRKT
ncbi:cell division protein [Pseudomonas veronii]|uniref:cell division protein n=1 Tax=Pseudomonas veronii TaxID=76761 RepID=UPI000F81E720|nr:cell division protein [Pseudomonas veronii]RTY68083.1 cell division protein [Pseudomonas veronii]